MSVTEIKKIATREAYGLALKELGEKNQDVIVLDADLSKSTMTKYFAKKFPDRFFNVGIAEANLVSMAAGFALSGKLPFASTFANFGAGRAFDQVRNSVAYPRTNVKLCVTHAGITLGEDGASHQINEDIAMMRALPNMTVIVPADAVEARAATLAIAEHDGPVYLRLGRPAVPVILPDDYTFRLGKAHVLRSGNDVALIACGIMVGAAVQAADALATAGIQARVINCASVKPLDLETVVTAAVECGAVVTAEEHQTFGGLGGAVAEAIAEHHPVPVIRVGIKDTFGESGTWTELLQKYGLTAADVVEAARRALAMKK